MPALEKQRELAVGFPLEFVEEIKRIMRVMDANELLLPKNDWKTVLCSSVMKQKVCKYGRKCRFAHSIDAIFAVHFRTNPNYKRGECLGRECSYQRSEDLSSYGRCLALHKGDISVDLQKRTATLFKKSSRAPNPPLSLVYVRDPSGRIIGVQTVPQGAVPLLPVYPPAMVPEWVYTTNWRGNIICAMPVIYDYSFPQSPDEHLAGARVRPPIPSLLRPEARAPSPDPFDDEEHIARDVAQFVLETPPRLDGGESVSERAAAFVLDERDGSEGEGGGGDAVWEA
jgi:hypothetical protein